MKKTPDYDAMIFEITEYPNKKHSRVGDLRRAINTHISGLRLTSLRMKGTTVGNWCMQESIRLEKSLADALGRVRV